MSDCIVKVILTDAPVYQIKVTNPARTTVKVTEELTKIIRVFEGPQGVPGTGGGTPGKAGVVAGASFSGTPKVAAITFVTPYADATYVITLSGGDSRIFTYQNKTAAGFTINSNANTALSQEVSWSTVQQGEA